MSDLSVIIPAKNEEWLNRTVEDVLAHAECDTEVIALCDGGWPPVPLETHPKLQVLYVPESIGQRAATNIGVKISTAKYVMKLDAHCSVSQGFDRVLIESAERIGRRDLVQIPAQKHLHVYDQVCAKCKHRADQAPNWNGACPNCKHRVEVKRVVVWEPRKKPTTTAWRLDETLHFQYWPEGQKRQVEGDIHDAMTSLGACFFMERAYFHELGGLDEAHGSWGQYGAEVALKTWLSGGRHVVNKGCWFAHFFRVGGIGFPYAITGAEQERAREYSRNLWRNNAWPKQIYPLKWVIDKFAPLPGWHDPSGANALQPLEQAAKEFYARTSASSVTASRLGTAGCVYYSDCRPDPAILDASRRTIERSGLPIVAVTLQPIDWTAAHNIVLPLERGYLAMFKQILAGLEALDTEFAFLVEHDLLYHSSHFEFRPTRGDRYYYNQNVYKVDAQSGHALHYLCNQTSGLCASRQLLIEHYRKRVAAVERDGFSRRNGFEPGTRKIRHGGFDDVHHDTWMSAYPNIDIRHGTCLTKSRWKKDEFRNQRYTAGWTESDSVPGWGHTEGRFAEILQRLQSERLSGSGVVPIALG
jgi:DNA-directed RNA polymerase subunit RPC12/RpoP